MPEWMVWAIVAGIGLVVALIIHALIRQARGSLLLGTLLMGIIGAFLAAWLLPRLVNMPPMTITEERFFWAVIGALVLSAIYELLSVGSHRSRILIPASGR